MFGRLYEPLKVTLALLTRLRPGPENTTLELSTKLPPANWSDELAETAKLPWQVPPLCRVNVPAVMVQVPVWLN